MFLITVTRRRVNASTRYVAMGARRRRETADTLRREKTPLSPLDVYVVLAYCGLSNLKGAFLVSRTTTNTIQFHGLR